MPKNNLDDTVAAIATPLGSGAIGIIKISGPKSLKIISKIFSKNITKFRELTLGWIKSGNKKIDQVMVVYFKAPNSYTGEDVIEIQSHSSAVVLNQILDLVLNSGARLAEAGEFSKRAFINGKIDLTQVEATNDIICSQSEALSRLAVDQLAGGLTKRIESVKQDLINIASHQSAVLDFSEEDILEQDSKSLSKDLSIQIRAIDSLLKNSDQVSRLREGYKVSIIGLPNAGKSTLLNKLIGYKRAIVTEVAGTTRDTLEESLNINGINIRLIDTAGLNSDPDKVEKIGIKRAQKELRNSNLILVAIEPKKLNQTFSYLSTNNILDLITKKTALIVLTKNDKSDDQISYKDIKTIKVSAKTGQNISKLKNIIYQMAAGQIDIESSLVTTKRQINILKDVKTCLQKAKKIINDKKSQDLLLVELQEAIQSLNLLTGEGATQQIIDAMFENFCIGK